MEKLNIAELLKDCPKGMELDCTMFENVTFVGVNCSRQFPIEIAVGGICTKYLTKEGCFHDITLLPESKCVIFPKGKTTWEGFDRPFKNGDIIYNHVIKAVAIFCKQTDDATISHCFLNILNELKIPHYHNKRLSDWRLATEEEKAELFQSIKDNGYRWNSEAKTLEKLIKPKFKVGDRIVERNPISNSWIVASVSSEYYGLKLPNGSESIGVLPISEQDDWELISVVPNFKVGDKIKKKGLDNVYAIEITAVTPRIYTFRSGNFQRVEVIDKDYELVSSKFDISTLKPFESKVLVRSIDEGLWKPAIYGFSHSNGCYVVGGACWKCCIPYEGNEHLRGKTDDCDDFYKTWEK